jgi:hypothetical protein
MQFNVSKTRHHKPCFKHALYIYKQINKDVYRIGFQLVAIGVQLNSPGRRTSTKHIPRSTAELVLATGCHCELDDGTNEKHHHEACHTACHSNDSNDWPRIACNAARTGRSRRFL